MSDDPSPDPRCVKCGEKTVRAGTYCPTCAPLVRQALSHAISENLLGLGSGKRSRRGKYRK